ncbi:hypothetical protein Moror_16736 [Moniliophthora roreri MCA 2997]|uniref:Uncharacterized protein n=1 Tax=Moniliophthora roreri (strain MCA 2997) TaxID=1381753 RepID=V2XQN2_MONRO|nr:hypothetical protein Moror_16736 [Moniliophthora roreri MCA 2997]
MRRVFIQLLSQDFKYASTFICTAINENVIYCPIYTGALILQTKKEDYESQTYSNSPDKKDLTRFSYKKKKVKPIPTMPINLLYLRHHDLLIYDGRPDTVLAKEGFCPLPAMWDNLSTLPRYNCKLPTGFIAMPGFTLSRP